MAEPPILLSAGGTGGHLFPAEALAHALIERGYRIHLATDHRAERYAADFPARESDLIRSATLGGRNPLALARMAASLFAGYRESRKLIGRIKPAVVVGFGGYPTVPPLLAAARAGVPTLLHEQNAVLGRANRFLASRVNGIAIGFKLIGDAPGVPIIETGNPVRPRVLAAAETPYPVRQSRDPLRLVIFGGSQGARFFSEILPAAIGLLDEGQQRQLSILQQAREEDEAALREAYRKLDISADIAPFFRDMPAEIARAHAIIARAGASTVTELAVIGRPSLLIPFPGSLDGDQANNALAMQAAGGATLIRQDALDAARLADWLRSALQRPDDLAAMAKRARETAVPDAAGRLADCVECVISGGDLDSLPHPEPA